MIKGEIAIQKADILILSGGGVRHVIDDMLSQIDTSRKVIIICSAFSLPEIRKLIEHRIDFNLPLEKTFRKQKFNRFIDKVLSKVCKNNAS